MFKPNFDICVKCNFPGMIVVKAGYCQRCNHEVKKEKKTERLASQGEQTQQELDELFYRAAWASKPHECEECGQKLKAFNRMFISHIISKGAYDSLRNDMRNFNILCYDHHQQWEFRTRTFMKIYEPNQIIIQTLKNEHYGKTK